MRSGPRMSCGALGHVAVVSLERWDEVWRRNQHLAHQLVAQGLCTGLTFIEPPARGTRWAAHTPEEGVTVLAPALDVPRRVGGLSLAALRTRARVAEVDVWWINDPVFGQRLLPSGAPGVYDVTDDWRTSRLAARIRRRLTTAEDELAASVRTTVCSEVLQERWRERYGVTAALVHNGVDVDAHLAAEPMELRGPGPHVGYVGTLHDERLDVPLVLELAASEDVGTLHLVGPDVLSRRAREALEASPKIRFAGPQPSAVVPRFLVAMDALLCPHVVTPFTLSLDAIKAYEYLASGRPVVATPTSGFQRLTGTAQVTVAQAPDFVAALSRVLRDRPAASTVEDLSWAGRAREFARELQSASAVPA